MREDLRNLFSGMITEAGEDEEKVNNVQSMINYVEGLESSQIDHDKYVEKAKYDELHKRYVNRFFSGSENNQQEKNPQNEDDEEKPKYKSISDLFK